MIRIGVWYADPQTCTLTRDEEQIKVPPRAMDVLCFLARHAGQVVSADTLLDEFWVSPTASDHAVHKTIVTLRRALGDSSQNPTYLQTFPKRGYALIAEVTDLGDSTSSLETVRIGQTEAPRYSTNTVNAKPATPTAKHSVIAASSVLLAAVVYLLFRATTPDTTGSLADEPSIIEISPVSVTGSFDSNEYSYLAHGLTTAVTASLSKLPNVRVFSRSNPNNQSSLPEGSYTDLNPHHILSADLVAQNDRVKVMVTLVNAQSDEIEYSDQLETSTNNMFSMQNRIVDNVANALRIVLDKSQMQAMHDWGTGDALAYDHLLKAEFYKQQWNQNDWQRAISHYQQAISIDPRFVSAYTGLATVANYLSVYSGQDQTAQLLGMLNEYQRQLALTLPGDTAIELLKSMALNIEGMHHAVLEKRYREQILSGTAPAYVFAQYGLMLQGARLYDEATQFLNLASSEDPYRTDPNQQSNFLTGSLTPWNAIAVKKDQLVDQPRHIGMLGTLVGSLALTGKLDAARYYLARQEDADSAGIRTHLSKISLSAMNGDLKQHRYLRLTNNSLAPKFDVEFPELSSEANLTDPDLMLNNGIMALISGDVENAAEYWRQIPQGDTRRLVTRLHASEKFFPESVLQSNEYAALLETMGVGLSWQQQLMKGVISMQDTTGIGLHPMSSDYLERGLFMPLNNLWTEEDWEELATLRDPRPYVSPSIPAASPP